MHLTFLDQTNLSKILLRRVGPLQETLLEIHPGPPGAVKQKTKRNKRESREEMWGGKCKKYRQTEISNRYLQFFVWSRPR